MRTVLLLLALTSTSLASTAEVQPTGRWPNGFAYSIVADRAGAWAYAASGGAILVARVGQGGACAVVAEIVTPGFVFGLALEGDVLFAAASRAGAFAIDVRDPMHPGAPKRIAAAEDIGYDVAARGDVVAFADGARGVVLLRRTDSGFVETGRVPLDSGRALGVAVGDGCCFAACGEAGIARIDLDGAGKPTGVMRAAAACARSVAIAGSFVLSAEDAGGLQLRDAKTLEVRGERRFALPPAAAGPGRSAKDESPLCVSRVRVLGERAYVGLEATPLASQISPFTPEFGAYRGEPHFDGRAAVACVSLAANSEGKPSLELVGQVASWGDRPQMNWIKDVAPLPDGGALALDFAAGAYRLQLAPKRGLAEVGFAIDTRAGAIDVAQSPSDPRLLYVSSDVGGLQIFDIADAAHPKLLCRLADLGGTFCGAAARAEKGADGESRPIDYVFVNNFFRVGICRVDPRAPKEARALTPLWITIPAALRGKSEFEPLGITPRSYRVAVDGDKLDVVSTNTVFGWQRFSIDEVLACDRIVNIYEGQARPVTLARACEPEFRAITSPDALKDATTLHAPPFARTGKSMAILVQGDQVILGAGGQKEGGGRGGRGSGTPHDGYLQLFDLSAPVVDDPVLGKLRFPRGTRFVEGGEILIGLARRGDELFVADSGGILRVVDVDATAHGPDVFRVRPERFENHGRFGLDSLFDVALAGDRLYLAGWSTGYLCLSADERDPAKFLQPLEQYDSPGLSISILLTHDGRPIVAEHDAGFLVMPKIQP